MTLPPEILKDLEAFKTKLPTVVKKKRVRRPDQPAVIAEPKPVLPKTENASKADPLVRRNGKGSWLVMVPTAAAYRGLKSREDPVVKDSPITRAPYGVSHMTGNTAQICNDAAVFRRKK